jgi:hypothetical protein
VNATALLVVGSACVVTGYLLGASGVVPRLSDRLRWKAEDLERAWLKRGRGHVTWYVLQTVYALMIARNVVIRPRRTVRAVKEARRLSPRRLPAELVDAARQAVRLHMPGSAAQFTHVLVPVYGLGPDLSNVAFGEDEIVFLTLGERSQHADGDTDPAALKASREVVHRLVAELKSPAGRMVRIDLTPR